MADDISIFVKVVGQKDIVSTTDSLNRMEGGVKRLSKDLSKGRINSDQYSTGLKELRRGVDSLFPSWQKAKTAVDQYSKGLIKATADQAKAKAAIEADKQATKAYTQARREATQEDQRRTAILKSNRDALNAQRVATEANTAQVHRYRMASDSVYAAEQKLLQLKKTLRTEIANGNMTLREAAAVQMQYKQSLNQVGTGLQQSRQRMSSMGVVTQQAGYQMGDFIVQVQSGQNALIAFSQQATQMVGFLPLMASKLGLTAGAAIGLSAVLGIAIPIISSLAMVLLTVKNSSDKSSESTKDFSDRLKAAREEVRGMSDDLSLLKSGFDNMFEKTLSDQVKKAQEELARATKNLMDLEEQGRGGHQKRISKQKLEDAQKAVQVAQEELDSARDIAAQKKEIARSESVINQLHEVRQQKIKDNYEAEKAHHAQLIKIKSLMGEIQSETTSVTQHTIDLTKNLGGSVEEAVRLQEALDSGQISASQLSGVDINKAISPAVKSAMELAKQLGISFRLAAAMSGAIVRGADPEALDPRSQRYDPAVANAARLKEVMESGDLYKDYPKAPSASSSSKGGGGGGKSPAEEAAEAIAKLQEQLTLQEALVGKTEAQRQVVQALGVDYEKIYGAKATDEIIARIEALKAEQEQVANIQSIADTMKSSMSDAFMSMVEGTKSFKDAMKDMARAVIKQLFDVLVVQQLVGSFGSGGGGILGSIFSALPSADGNVFSGGSQVKAYANGGVVGGPTYFPMSGGKTGLMGEAGPEAIMPLKRGANGKLGVQMEGSSGGEVNIVQNFSFQANGDDSVKKLIAQAAPQIAQMTQKQIMDSRRRGGAMKSTFG